MERLTEEQGKAWKEVREAMINNLLEEIGELVSECPPKVADVIRVGITRSIDCRYNTAADKLKAIDGETVKSLEDLTVASETKADMLERVLGLLVNADAETSKKVTGLIVSGKKEDLQEALKILND